MGFITVTSFRRLNELLSDGVETENKSEIKGEIVTFSNNPTKKHAVGDDNDDERVAKNAVGDDNDDERVAKKAKYEEQQEPTESDEEEFTESDEEEDLKRESALDFPEEGVYQILKYLYDKSITRDMVVEMKTEKPTWDDFIADLQGAMPSLNKYRFSETLQQKLITVVDVMSEDCEIIELSEFDASPFEIDASLICHYFFWNEKRNRIVGLKIGTYRDDEEVGD